MFKRSVRLGLCGVVFTFQLFSGGVSFAAAPELLGQFGDWSAYVLNDGGRKVCYMAGVPMKKEGKYKNRGEVFAMITHNPSDNTRDIFSFISGYTYQKDSKVKVFVDGSEFHMFTQEDTAWTPDAADDVKIVAKIRKGSKMVVKGTSKLGNETNDSFSLKGSGDAYAEISGACGL